MHSNTQIKQEVPQNVAQQPKTFTRAANARKFHANF